MKDSLSLVLPVQDCQAQIEARMVELLEFLCDLTTDAQVIVIDDCSRDATPEVLEDLRRRFPQMEVYRTASRVGASHAAESMLDRALGDFIFLNQSFDDVNYEEILQLWTLRKDEQLIIARASTRIRRIDQHLLQRLHAWGKRLEDNWPPPRASGSGLQMMRREGIKELSNLKDSATALEVTHQSHRRISAPKLLSAVPTASPQSANAS